MGLGFFIFKDVIKFTWNEVRQKVGTGWDCHWSLSTGFYPLGRRGTRLNQPVWGQNKRLCWLFWEGRCRQGHHRGGLSWSTGSCKGRMREEAGSCIPAFGVRAASTQGSPNIFHFHVDIKRVKVCDGDLWPHKWPVLASLATGGFQHLCKMKEGARWD